MYSNEYFKWRLYLITKLQNLKAIHNEWLPRMLTIRLYLITKLQNLKAIHNVVGRSYRLGFVVSNYKITKSESYSQHLWHRSEEGVGCI